MTRKTWPDFYYVTPIGTPFGRNKCPRLLPIYNMSDDPPPSLGRIILVIWVHTQVLWLRSVQTQVEVPSNTILSKDHHPASHQGLITDETLLAMLCARLPNAALGLNYDM
jgi:hypothetical protein